MLQNKHLKSKSALQTSESNFSWNFKLKVVGASHGNKELDQQGQLFIVNKQLNTRSRFVQGNNPHSGASRPFSEKILASFRRRYKE